MALGTKDKDKFFLQSLDVYRGVIDPSTDVFASGVLLAYTMPDFNLKFNKTYAEFKDGIPKTSVRKDLIEQVQEMEFKVMEWDSGLIDLLTEGKAGTIGTSGAVYYGSEPEAVSTIYGWEFRGKTVDGKVASFFIRKGRITTEDLSLAIGGGDYSPIPVKLTAEVDENVTDAAKNLSFWAFEA